MAEHPAPTPLARLLGAFPRSGSVTWIGVRPARREPLEVRQEVEAAVGHGLLDDHFAPKPGGSGNRQVTLIQAEHLPVVAALAGLDHVEPGLLRRNLVVAGINLQALKHRRIRVGGAVLAITTPCDPCSRMEEALGEGGYNAMRGHGGWNARVLEAGPIRLGDPVRDHGPV